MKIGDTLQNGAEVLEAYKLPDGIYIVLAKWAKNPTTDEWVTWNCSGDGNARWGHYFQSEIGAREDYAKRRKKGI